MSSELEIWVAVRTCRLDTNLFAIDNLSWLWCTISGSSSSDYSGNRLLLVTPLARPSGSGSHGNATQCNNAQLTLSSGKRVRSFVSRPPAGVPGRGRDSLPWLVLVSAGCNAERKKKNAMTRHGVRPAKVELRAPEQHTECPHIRYT